VPLAQQIGLDPLQLGLMMVLNLGIGLYTPPVGTTLFHHGGDHAGALAVLRGGDRPAVRGELRPGADRPVLTGPLRGGPATKLHALADAFGRLVVLALAPGQTAGNVGSRLLIEGVPEADTSSAARAATPRGRAAWSAA
jgi:hypothetical protein